ncbi:MAG: ATP-binding protein [Fibrobacterota bacterium]
MAKDRGDDTLYQKEVQAALALQTGLSPSAFAKMEGLRLSSDVTPGDLKAGRYYDTIRLSDDELALFTINIDSRDIPAAYLAAMSRMALQHHLRPERPAGEILSAILASLPSQISTLQSIDTLLCIYDRRTNEARFSGLRGLAGYWAGPEGALTTVCLPALPDSMQGVLTDGRQFLEQGERFLLPFRAPNHEAHFSDALRQSLLMDKDGGRRLLERLRKTLGSATDPVPCFLLEATEPPRRNAILAECGLPASEPFTIRSLRNFDQMREVIKDLVDEADAQGHSLRFQKNFRLVLLELLTNAIIHGNRNAPDKKVVVVTQITPAHARVGVIDEGKGYNDKGLPNPLLPENMNKPHGRGVYIIKHYTDDFQLRGCGNCTMIRIPREKD